MPKYIPANVDDETRRALNSIWETLEEFESGNAPLNQRRFTDAGSATGQSEYITKFQLEEAISRVVVSSAGAARGRAVASTTLAGQLPPPNHPMDFGYFHSDGKYGDHYAEVKDYTNLYYAWVWQQYDTTGNRSQWLADMQHAVNRAHADGKTIYLQLGQENDSEAGDMVEVFQTISNAWDSVKYVALADEPENFGWSGAGEVDNRMYAIWDKAEQAGLQIEGKFWGCNFSHDALLEGDWADAASLDFVGTEAYITAPGGTADQNQATMNSDLDAAIARIPDNKQIEIVMQAYDRNGHWTDIDTLAKLQDDAYLRVKDEQRVMLMTMFAYGRPGGTFDHPELAVVHKKIWAALQGNATPFSFPTQGRKKTRARAYIRRMQDALNQVVHTSAPIIDPTGRPVLTTWANGVTLRDRVLDNLSLVKTIRARAHPTEGNMIEITGAGNKRFHEAYAVFDAKLGVQLVYQYTEAPNKVGV